MKLDKIHNARRNIIWGMLNHIVTMLCPFILRTVMIGTIGIEYLGISGLFSSILQVLSLADLGFGGAIVYSMYKPIADDDSGTICALLKLYRKIYFCIGLAIMVMGVAVLPFIKYFIKGSYPQDSNIYALFAVYLFNTVFSYIFFAYKEALFKAHQRIDVTSKTLLIMNAGMYFTQIVVLCLFRSYFIYALIMPAATIIRNLLNYLIANKMYPAYQCRGRLDRTIIGDIKKNVFGLMLYKICGVFRNSFDNIIISSFLGLIILARFQNYYMIMNAVIAIMYILSSSIIAGLGNSIMTKEKEKVYEDFKLWFFGYNWLAGWCAIGLLCLTQPVIELWMGKENLFPVRIVCLIAIYFYSLKAGDITAVYREAAGLWWEDRYRPVIEAVSNLLLNIIFVKLWGVSGVLLSTIITIICINIPCSAYILLNRFFQRKAGVYLKELSSTAFYVLAVGAFTYFICINLKLHGIAAIMARGAICLIIPNLLFTGIYYQKNEFREFFKLMEKAIYPKK